MAKDPKDADGRGDAWQFEATRPPDASKPRGPSISALPEWGDSVLDAVERVEAEAKPVDLPRLPPRRPPPPPPPKPAQREVPPLPDSPEDEEAQAAEFFRAAAQNVWGVREESGSVPEINLESGLLTLDSVSFDLSGTFDVDSRPPAAAAFALDDRSGRANLGAFEAADPERDDLSDVLAAIQDDSGFGKERVGPPPPPKPAREPSALAGAAPRRPTGSGLPPLIDYDPALDPEEQFGASFDPKGLHAPVADEAPVLELEDALVASGRYAAKTGQSSEAVRVVHVRRPSKKD